MCRMIVADGNFKAELLRPKKPEADVALTAGEGYVTEKEKYAKHVAEGKDFPQVYVSGNIFQKNHLKYCIETNMPQS